MSQKKIIILPGTLDCPFFINEISIIKKKFDSIHVFPYHDKKNNHLAKKNQIKCEVGNAKYVTPVDLIRLLKWIGSKHVIREIKNNVNLSKKGLKKLTYICWYGLYLVQVYDDIKRVIDTYNGEVYLYSYWLSRPAYVVSMFVGNPKVKKVFSRAHGYDLYEYRNDMDFLPFREVIYGKLDFISFISQDGQLYYQDQIRERSMHYFADSKISYLGTYYQDLKKNIKKKDSIVIASCSSIIQLKRLDLIIDAIGSLKEYNVRWIHYGIGQLEKEIKKEAAQRLNEKQFFFKGYFDNKDLLSDYVAEDVDFFINLSDTEGLPVSIMEAMSLGIPVIARNVGGIREIVQKDNGLLISKDNKMDMISEIQNFIIMCITNPEIYKQYSQKAKEKWELSFSAEKNYNNFFDEIIND